MSRNKKHLVHLVTGVLLSLFSGSPVFADDVEIYLGANLGVTNVPPNILFIIDTSGSMGTTIATQTSFDPSAIYSGCFDSDRVYFTTSTSCSDNNLDDYVNLSAVKCQALLDQFSTTGYLTDKFARWRSNAWRSLSDNRHNDEVECSLDSGVHGDGGAATYASESNGPWSSIQSEEIDWDGENAYTMASGNYMNWKRSGATVYKTRLEIVQETVSSLVNSISSVNIGLMRFDRDSEGGMVVTPMGYIDTVKADFLTELNKMWDNGGTPLAQSLYEAALYYQGKGVDYGNRSRATHKVNGIEYTEDYLSHHNSRNPPGGNTYDSPIDFQCQKNYVVLLTDGEPSQNDTLTSTQKTTTGVGSCSKKYDSNDWGTTPDMYHCLPAIASALQKDLNSSMADVQNVSTYTIGFATDQELLKDTAAAGNGSYDTADDAAKLSSVFMNFITDIIGDSNTFSSPAVSVNAFNRTTHRSELYFSLFAPSNGPHWDGNFKRYKLSFNNDNEPVIKDVNDNDAVGTDGYFRNTAQSYWSPGIDGKEAEEGGAASRLTNTRKVYTYTGSNSTLSDSSNLLHESNAAVTDTMLGVVSTERNNLLKWARGIDVDDVDQDGDVTDARVIMGDPLHGEPAMIQYGGTTTDPDITAFVPTNDGYLHAIDTRVSQGTEIFSFVPRELLPNLNFHYENSTANTKVYGLDGSVTAWVNDENKDGIISGSDHAYIYFGMRRGGNNYYAMDVTDRSNPRLMWTIQGGSGDFAELGETWSRPKLRKLRLAGQDKYVLIFGGGYDSAQDGASVRTEDSIGRAIYIVDAETGQRLWWASSLAGADLTLPAMDYSIPSDIAVVDSVGDDYANIMYVGDMGGQVWRFDIAKSETASSLSTLITGGRIADLAVSGSTADARRFYYPPEVAISNYEGSYYINLIIGSGYRAHPLNTDIQDRIYMIRDLPIKYAPTSYTLLTEADLFDTTNNAIGEGTAVVKAQARTDLASAHGWYIDLEVSGEKILAKPVVFAGMAFITSYMPTDLSAGQSCSPSQGTGRVYIVDVLDGRPTYTNDPTVEKDNLVKDDRFKDLKKAGIPADPKFINTGDPNQKDWAVCVGTECFSMPNTSVLKELYWFER